MMKEDYFGEEKRTAPWKSALSILLIVVMVIFLLRIIKALLVPIIALVLLFANRDLVLKIVHKINALYQDKMYKGLLATLAAFILFTPFLVFLFFRTIYNVFADPNNMSIPKEEQGTKMECDTELESLESRVKRLLREDKNNRY